MPTGQPKDQPFELVFWGGSDGIRYRRRHKTVEAAKDEAYRVMREMSNAGAHPAIIHGPGLGPDGISLMY